MAAAYASHGTLTANVAASVPLTSHSSDVEILNRSTTDPIFVRTDGVNPTVLGDDSYIVPAGQALRVGTSPPAFGLSGSSVRLISAGAAPYSVTGF